MFIANAVTLIIGWLFFYKILKARKKRFSGIKASLITLLFASLLFQISGDFSAVISRAYFSLNKSGEILLSESVLKIPENQSVHYCNQFRDQNNDVIHKTSDREDGRYCGEFWHFNKDKRFSLPYKIESSQSTLYWASPSLTIKDARKKSIPTAEDGTPEQK